MGLSEGVRGAEMSCLHGADALLKFKNTFKKPNSSEKNAETSCHCRLNFISILDQALSLNFSKKYSKAVLRPSTAGSG